MSLAFALPIGLAALASLLLPLLLHLVRRAEHRTTPFSALRFLRAAGLPRRRIRVAERALLALRCVLLAVLALLLAQPLLRREPEPRHVVAVAPGVSPQQARAFAAPGRELRWLAPDFPLLEHDAPDARQALASLLRELDATLAPSSRLELVVPAVVTGLDAERPRLSREVGWHVVPAAGAGADADGPAQAPRRLALHAPADDAIARRYLAAAVAAWNAERAGSASLAEVDAGRIPPDATALFWLDGAPSADAVRWIEAGGTAVLVDAQTREGEVLARDGSGAPLLRARGLGRGRVLALAQPFSPASWPLLNDPGFPRALAAWLDPAPPPPDRAVADALRPVSGGTIRTPRAEPLAPWLALLAAALFALERAWASGLRRRTAR